MNYQVFTESHVTKRRSGFRDGVKQTRGTTLVLCLIYNTPRESERKTSVEGGVLQASETEEERNRNRSGAHPTCKSCQNEVRVGAGMVIEKMHKTGIAVAPFLEPVLHAVEK